MKRNILLIITSFVFLFFSSFTYNAESISSVKIFSPDSKPFGMSYEDHVQNYWKWILSLPTDNSAYKDPTGEKCAVGQSNSNSSVFNLAGGGGGKHDRTCKIPAGKGVLIPILHVELSDKEVPNAPVEELSRLATIDQNHVTSLFLEINGEKIFDEKYPKGIENEKNSTAAKYRTHTGDFEVVFPTNALYGVSPGKSKVVADGFYIITEPLEKGTYNVVFKGTIFCELAECLDVTFAQDMNYKLIVE